MSVKFKMDWILFALVKSKICELNLLREEHDPVLVTLQFPWWKASTVRTTVLCSAGFQSCESTYLPPGLGQKKSETQVKNQKVLCSTRHAWLSDVTM